MDLERVAPARGSIHCPGRKLFLIGQGHGFRIRQGNASPSFGQARPIPEPLLQPGVPCAQLVLIPVGPRGPQFVRVRETRLVDQIPHEKRHVLEALDDRDDQILLATHRFRIEIWVRAAQNLGDERKERKLHGKPVLLRGHEKSFQGAQHFLVDYAALLHHLIPGRPPARAQHVEPSAPQLGHVLIPDVRVRAHEEFPLDVTRHISGPQHQLGLSVKFEQVFVHAHAWPGTKRGFLTQPEAGAINTPQGAPSR